LADVRTALSYQGSLEAPELNHSTNLEAPEKGT